MSESFKDYSDMGLADLGRELRRLKDKLEEEKAVATKTQKEYDRLRKEVIPEVAEDHGITSMNISGIGRLGIRPELYVSIEKDHKEEAYDWLRENNHEDLIQGTVNASTLKAFVKEQIKNGEELPDDLFVITPFMMATITKA